MNQGAVINIIEERPIPNIWYYDSLKKKYGNDYIKNIYFRDNMGISKVLIFSGETKILIWRNLIII